MSLLDRIVKKKATTTQSVNLTIEPGAAFTSYSGDAYSNDIYRGAVDAMARNIAKLKGMHVINYSGKKVQGDAKLNRILQTRPNPYMSAYDFLYKMATHYYLYNNSFALLIREGRNVAAIYPITANHTEILTDNQGGLYCRFIFKSGKDFTFPYEDLIHLRRNFNSDDFLGDENGALFPALELAHTQNEGAISAIRSGANIRGILKFTQLISPERLKAEKDNFVRDFLDVDNTVIATDTKYDFQPLKSDPVILSAEQTQEIKTKIYDYLGISENIVNSSYNENEFAAFYGSVVEPFAMALSQEFTAKLFNEREQAFGNSIIFETGHLQFSSLQTRTELIKELLPMGIITINQALEMLNLPSIDGGERRLQSLNYVDQSHVTEYQLASVGAIPGDPKNEEKQTDTEQQDENKAV